ncbi:MAG: serine hydrolase domain-containing protein [Candidatus Thorarchaeota archaeon]
MSSIKLAEMETHISQLPWGNLVQSVLIIRNGYIVHESYYNPAFGMDQITNIFSCTKSLSSTLIGIAIDEGYIAGVNQTLTSFFPNRTIANLDARKQAITLQHILTMESGLAWDEWPYGADSSFTYMIESPDWVQYVLDQPMRYDPGEVWDYNSGGSHLLSMIVNQTAGTSTEEFAETHIFSPLGITNYQWGFDPQGVVFGGSNLALRPRDMAKFGYLFLNNGTWNGEELVSSEWVNESTTNYAMPYADNSEIGYGYQWWLNLDINTYLAIGYNGQQINIVPEHNLVVVFTATYEGASYSTIMSDYIIPAIGYVPTYPRFPLSFGQLQLISVILAGVVIVIPLIVEGIFQFKARRSHLSHKAT